MVDFKEYFKQLFPDARFSEGKYGIVFYIDCLEAMEKIPAQFFKMVITDPPYNVQFTGKSFGGKSIKKNTTLVPLANDNMSEEDFWKFNDLWLQRVLRIAEGLMFTCGIQNLFDWIQRHRPPYLLKGWYKPAAESFQDFDPILSYGKIRHIFPNYILRVNIKTVEHCDHECPKPIELYRQILTRLKYPNPICDPFVGSGTILQAAEEYGINALCFESDYERLHKTIEWRINQGMADFGKQVKLDHFV